MRWNVATYARDQDAHSFWRSQIYRLDREHLVKLGRSLPLTPVH